MMNTKTSSLALALLAMIKIAGAQDVTLTNDYSERTVKIFDITGKPFANPNLDAEGSPFFIDGWKRGSVRLNNDSLYKNVPLRLELLNQEIHFLSIKNGEMILDPGILREFILFDSVNNSPVQYKFRNGFPSVDYQNEKSFYLMLNEGKLIFLESIRKKIIEIKKDMSGEKSKEFRSYEDYYFYAGIKLQPLKRNREYLLGIMNDQQQKILNFVSANNLSYKSIEDIKKIVSYYNSL